MAEKGMFVLKPAEDEVYLAIPIPKKDIPDDFTGLDIKFLTSTTKGSCSGSIYVDCKTYLR